MEHSTLWQDLLGQNSKIQGWRDDGSVVKSASYTTARTGVQTRCPPKPGVSCSAGAPAQSQKTGGWLGLAGFHPSRKTANPPSEILTHGKRWNNRDQDTWCPLLTSMHMQRHTPIRTHVQTCTQTHTCMQARIQIKPFSKIWNPSCYFSRYFILLLPYGTYLWLTLCLQDASLLACLSHNC